MVDTSAELAAVAASAALAAVHVALPASADGLLVVVAVGGERLVVEADVASIAPETASAADSSCAVAAAGFAAGIAVAFEGDAAAWMEPQNAAGDVVAFPRESAAVFAAVFAAVLAVTSGDGQCSGTAGTAADRASSSAFW